MIMRKAIAVTGLCALPFVISCGGGEAPKSEAPAAPPTTAAAPAEPAGTASIAGKVSFEGTVTPGEKVKLNADPKCAEMHKGGMERQPIKVVDGGLAEVLVYVKSPVSGTYPAPAEPVSLDQKGCDYSPHMVTVQAGQGIKIRNSDDTLHNIHPRPTINEEFNFGQAKQGMEKVQTFDKPEVMIPVGCDVHPWMRAYVSVFSHPFYTVTKDDGTFEIKGLPAGEYEVEAIHGKLKGQTQKVTVKSGEAVALNFAYKS
ncbi:MAG TPA: carboxypeptidase regulatory-like domain-containing protein [Vicinamibacteria bacterium]